MITFSNCKVLYNGRFVRANLIIDDCFFYGISKSRVLGKEVNLSGKIVLPAMIDPHVHMRDLELSYKEDFVSGSRSAIRGGVCLILDMPNTKPRTNSELGLKKKLKAAKKSCVDYGIFFEINNENLYTCKEVEDKVVGFKAYLELVSYETLKVAYEFLGKNIVVHAEDPAYFNDRSIDSLEKYCLYRNLDAEINAVIKLSKIGKFFIAHISSAKSLKYNHIYECTPHHLLLSYETLRDNRAIVNPPLRSEKERVELWKSFICGKISYVGSDHAPHTLEEKDSGFPGFSSLEVTYFLFLDMLLKNKISPKLFGEMLAENVAKLFKLQKYGGVKIGNYANFVVVDPKKTHTIKILESKGKYSPFLGYKTQGEIEEVYIRGVKVFDREVIAKEGFGKNVLK